LLLVLFVGLLMSGTAASPGGTFLALDNYCDDGGDAVDEIPFY
jgi:hypothetical protein